MLEIRDQGLAQHIGLTGSDLVLMRDVLAECDDFVSVITFLKYDLLVQTAKENLLPTAADRDVAIILASPLHAGLLGSKRDAWQEAGRFAELYPKLEKVEALLADEPGDMPDHGLRYLLSDPQVSVLLHRRGNIRRTRSIRGRFRRPLPITRTHRPHRSTHPIRRNCP